MKKSIVWFIVIAIIMSIVQGGLAGVAYADDENLIEPYPGMVIKSDVKFAPGTYDFHNSDGMVIAADNVVIDGNGAVLKGGMDRINTPTSGEYEFWSGKAGPEADNSMTTVLDLTGSEHVILEYDAWYDIEPGWDAGMVQVSADGENWVSLSTPHTTDEFDPSAYPSIKENLPAYTGNSGGWIHEAVDISSHAGKKIYLRFRYMTDWATEMQGFYVDSITVIADDEPIFGDDAESGMQGWQNDGWSAVTGLLDKPGFAGIGIKAEGISGVTIKNVTVKGFNQGLYIKNGSKWTVEDNNFSDNFTDPDYGWGDGNPYGAIMLESVQNSIIRRNKGNNVWNGLYLKYSNKNIIENNDFSHTSNVSLKMWNACENTISDNDFSYGIRIAPGEVHARDSSSMLMESGSDDNRFYRNNFTHGGDGIFIRPLNGWVSTGNYFEENDTSYANNNAIECWSPGNTFVRNKADYSSYGFWLGGSDNTVLIGNEVKYNGGYNGIGKRNAPEAFGNAGIAVVNGPSSHFMMMNNDIQYNNGPGVAIRYNADYPAYHWIIQQNTIKNNKNDDRGYKGYGIYVKNARWLDIAGNDISDNDADALFIDSNVSDVFTRQATMADKPPIVRASVSRQAADVGQEIIFDASRSSAPKGSALYYRWDLGDDTIENGAVVRHKYREPGFYRVGITVNNGKLADLMYFNIYITDPGQELGTNKRASEWSFSSDDPKAQFMADTQYHIKGERSICVSSHTGMNNVLIYPKSKRLDLDISKKDSMVFWIKFNAEAQGGSTLNRPIVRLYQDENNYIEYSPKVNYFLDKVSAPVSEQRYGWTYVNFKLSGTDPLWNRKTVGNPSLKDINYIWFNEGPHADGKSDFWLDGLQFLGQAKVDTSPNIAVNTKSSGYPAPIYSYSYQSDKQGYYNPWAPLSGLTNFTGSITPRWSSLSADGSSVEGWYGVDFGVPREMNKVDIYFYHNPSGTESMDTEWKPKSYTVQYWNGNKWVQVPNMVKSSSYVVPNLNSVTFDVIESSKVRVVMQHHRGNVIPTFSSIYALQVFNTANIAGNRFGESYPNPSVTSSVTSEISLERIGVLLNYRSDQNGPALTDLVVELYNVEGNKPAGEPVKVVEVPKDSVNFGNETQINIDYAGLQPGHRYAIALTQKVLAPNGTTGEHYRWPTKQQGINEYFGKYAGGNFVDESSLGTAWLKVYTDKGTIDYSFSNAGSGWGVGHVGEAKRWQTFTLPNDKIWQAIDGSIGDGNGWVTRGSGHDEDWIEIDFKSPKRFNKMNVFFGDDEDDIELPVDYKVQYWNGNGWSDVVVRTKPESVTGGFNAITFKPVFSQKVRMIVTNPPGFNTEVREIEVSQS